MDWLKDLDPVKVLIWVAPGAFIAMFRSFFLKGSFPTIGKDDLAAFVLGSVVYRFLALGFLTQDEVAKLSTGGWFWLLFIGLAPSILGFLLGIFEASDATGAFIRRFGVQMPTPNPSAWETLFRKLPPGAGLVVTLKDGTVFYGRWSSQVLKSCVSSGSDSLDIYIGEIGEIDADGKYLPYSPPRGNYLSAGEIRNIEVIPRSKKWLTDNQTNTARLRKMLGWLRLTNSTSR